MPPFKFSLLNKHRKGIFTCLSLLTLVSLFFAIYLGVRAPDDYLQGVYAKIMYIHIPCAWFSLGLYCMTGLLSVGYIAIKNPNFDIAAYACAKAGIVYTLITLVTGAIWGKPTWGTWWVWDARLTSMLVLFFIYFGYLALRNTYFEEGKAAMASSIFAVIGLVNIPIIKFSVHLWNTLHQESSFLGAKGITIHQDFLYPLIASGLFFLFYTCIVLALLILKTAYKRRYKKYYYIA